MGGNSNSGSQGGHGSGNAGSGGGSGGSGGIRGGTRGKWHQPAPFIELAPRWEHVLGHDVKLPSFYERFIQLQN